MENFFVFRQFLLLKKFTSDAQRVIFALQAFLLLNLLPRSYIARLADVLGPLTDTSVLASFLGSTAPNTFRVSSLDKQAEGRKGLHLEPILRSNRSASCEGSKPNLDICHVSGLVQC